MPKNLQEETYPHTTEHHLEVTRFLLANFLFWQISFCHFGRFFIFASLTHSHTQTSHGKTIASPTTGLPEDYNITILPRFHHWGWYHCQQIISLFQAADFLRDHPNSKLGLPGKYQVDIFSLWLFRCASISRLYPCEWVSQSFIVSNLK